MNPVLDNKELVYDSPALYLSPFSRLLVKVLALAFFVVIGVVIFILLLSSGGNLFYAGLLLLFFYIDRAFHVFVGDVPLRRDLPRIISRTQAPFNIEPYFHPKSKSLIINSFNQAELHKDDLLEFYLLTELLSSRLIARSLARLGVDSNKVLERLSGLNKISMQTGVPSEVAMPSYFDQKTHDPFKKLLLGKLQTIAIDAFSLAYTTSSSIVHYYFLFPSLLQSSSPELRKIFADFNLNLEDVVTTLNFEIFKNKISYDNVQPLAFLSSKKIKKRLVNRAWTSRPTPFLDSLSEDLTDLARARKIGFLIGHTAELDRLINVISRKTRNNALLLGEAGVGKTSVAWHLAKRIVDDEVPEALFDKRLNVLDIGAIVSGAEASEIQEKITKIAEEILRAKNIILYIPDFHSLKLTAVPGQLTAFDILKPYLRASSFQIIGDSDPLSYERYLTTDPDFMETFEVIRIEEISESEATLLLSLEGLLLEKQYNVVVQAAAIKQAVNLAKRYLRPKVLPSSARDVLAEALEEAKRTKTKTLTEQDIIDLISRMTRIPLERAKGKEAEKLLDLENQLHKRLINQNEAVSVVAQSLRQFRAGLARKKGPIASFLFVGPTGVGKTELSKALAEIYFGSEDQMVRLDMSEYQLKESLSRFIGTREGVAGTFAQAVKDKPYTLILLDEFEKAHPDILNLFLAIFDDGRMTDALGRTVDFQNTIMISTSNAHSNLIKDELDKGTLFTAIVDLVKKRLTEYFKPELLNRFDAVVIFKPLGTEEILQIAQLQLKSLAKDLEREQGIIVSFDNSVLQQLSKEGFDPVFGARPLRRVISARIRDTLANMILKGEIARGSNMLFTFEAGQFKVRMIS